MSTIKLKRGTGSPAGSLVTNEVAMDTSAKKVYVSTDGTNAVVLADSTETFLADATDFVVINYNTELTGENGNFSDPILKLSNDLNGYNRTQLILNNSTDDVSAISAYIGGPASNYIHALTMDPNNDVPGNTAADGSGTPWATWPGDYGFYLSKEIQDQDDIKMQIKSFGGPLTIEAGGNGEIGYGPQNIEIKGKRLIVSPNGDTHATFTDTGTNITSNVDIINYGLDDGTVPLTVRVDSDGNDAVVADFLNESWDQEVGALIRLGATDAGDKYYNNMIDSRYTGEEKRLTFKGLSDDAADEYPMWSMRYITADNSIKHSVFGQLFQEVNTDTYSSNQFLTGTVPTGGGDSHNFLACNLDFGANAIPDGASGNQSFSADNTATGAVAVGKITAVYGTDDTDNTMKLTVDRHDYSDSVAMGINFKHAYVQVPFKYQPYSTTERNALSVDSGSVIWNTTDSKLQVWTGSAWDNMH